MKLRLRALEVGQLFHAGTRHIWEYRGNGWYGTPGGQDGGPWHDPGNPYVQPRNARFWAFINGGPVKLTLEPWQAAFHSYCERTDEGWAGERTQWTHEDGGMRREWTTDGHDCDGRLTRTGTEFCPLERLQGGDEPYLGDDDPETWAGVVWPAWEREAAGQRDYQAEAAGY